MSEAAKKALETVLANEKWREMIGLDEDTIYGDLAMDVADEAIKAERDQCAALAIRLHGCDGDQIANAIRSRA